MRKSRAAGGKERERERRSGCRIRSSKSCTGGGAEFLALKHVSRILGHSSKPLCGFSMMEQVRLCAVWHFLEPDTGLDYCPRILLSCFIARPSEEEEATLCGSGRAAKFVSGVCNAGTAASSSSIRAVLRGEALLQLARLAIKFAQTILKIHLLTSRRAILITEQASVTRI